MTNPVTLVRAHVAWVTPGAWGGHYQAVCSCGERGESRTGSGHAHAWAQRHEDAHEGEVVESRVGLVAPVVIAGEEETGAGVVAANAGDRGKAGEFAAEPRPAPASTSTGPALEPMTIGGAE